MKKVLITGASGALGKAVVSQLADASANAAAAVTPWQILKCGRHASAGVDVILDVNDRAQVHSVITSAKPDLILHLAATLEDDFDAAYAVNVEGARNICDAIAASGYGTRLLLAGSAAEYGVVDPEHNPLRTNHPLQPVSIYGLTKAWQSMLGFYYAQRGVDVLIARIFNLDGEGLSDRLFSGRIRRQVAAIKAGEQDRLKIGALDAIRDYVSLGTAAAQIIAIAARGERGRTYHVGSGKGISMRELLRAYLEQEGLDFSVVEEAGANSNRKGYDVPVIYADMTATEALLAGKDATRK